MYIRLIILFLLTSLYSFAQTPTGGSPDLFGYQGVARDDQGNPLVDEDISLRISILEGSTSGTVSYSETHSVTTDEYGMFDIMVGGGTAGSNTMADIKWGSDEHFIKVEMDETGTGNSYQLMGTTQLVSVPYAKYADRAKYVDSKLGLNICDFFRRDDCDGDVLSPNALLLWEVWLSDSTFFLFNNQTTAPWFIDVMDGNVQVNGVSTVMVSNGMIQELIESPQTCQVYDGGGPPIFTGTTQNRYINCRKIY